MARFLPLVVFVLWLAATAEPGHRLPEYQLLAIFAGGFVFLVTAMGVLGLRVARHIRQGEAQQRLRRFHVAMFVARVAVAAWLAVGIYLFGWKLTVLHWFSGTVIDRWHVDSPALILGTLPALLAWVGLLWAQYPADFALWEKNLLVELEENLPIQEPPTFWGYLNVNIRLKILFALAPALVLFVFRDVLTAALWPMAWMQTHPNMFETLTMLPPFAIVLLFGSEILRRILVTERMPESPLRDRLLNISRRNGVGVRDVLLWHTRHQMGNAAVIGLAPQVRYILMSDLLVETLGDEQIEAVFAHEMGHVRHRHLFWLVATVYGLLVALAGPGQLVTDQLQVAMHHVHMNDTIQEIVLGLMGLALAAWVVGFISRKFERQADVFAARTMQATAPEVALAADMPLERDLAVAAHGNSAAVTGEHRGSYVGHYGAHAVASALYRVAAINNIPVASRSWTHGSIAQRISFIRHMGGDPSATRRFDRVMRRLYWVLFLCLMLVSAYLAFAILQGGVAVSDVF